PIIPRGNDCLDAAKACNLDDTCKKYRSAYINPCTNSMSNEVCNRRKCHKALRQFFDKVPAKHSYGMLFCSCKDVACTERRRQTIVPLCSYEEKEKPNCLNLQETCKTNYICRSRLADFLTDCQPEPRSPSGCLKENYAECLLAYSGLIGTGITPNYIGSNSLSVSPWCNCSNSGNYIDDCLKFLTFFKDNICLKNAIQAFGNGTDVRLQPDQPVQSTTSPPPASHKPKTRVTDLLHFSNEIPTHNGQPACANLQQNKSVYPSYPINASHAPVQFLISNDMWLLFISMSVSLYMSVCLSLSIYFCVYAQKSKSNVSEDPQICVVEQTRGTNNIMDQISTEDSSESLSSLCPLLFTIATTHSLLITILPALRL
ncbi:hypothetical protein XELAEV_18034260mg, partial [Xenopus laevis]